MIAVFLITLRESLEAALVVGIILAYLERTKNTAYNRHIYLGVFAGVLASIVVAFLIQSILGGFSGVLENLFEGSLMLSAATLMGWMIIWMMNQGGVRARIEAGIQQKISAQKVIGLVLFTFLSIFREGVETVIFILAAVAQNSTNAFAGVILGFSSAVLMALFIFETAIKVDLRKFFTITSVVLVVFAAGIFAHGVHEFQEAGWLPAQQELWNTRNILDDEGTMGSMVRTMTGYNDSPTPYEVIAYVGYYGIFLIAQRTMKRH
jgi:high-affinity iron transporter